MTATRVLFVTSPSPQTELFVEYLQETLQCVVEACHHEASIPSSSCLVLIDSTQCSLAQMMRWSHIDKITAFNVEHEDDAISLLLNIPFSGIFYRQDSLLQISKGIGKILDGENWLTRNIMQTLIRHYRQQQQIAFQPIMGLTQRELEILSLIASQQSNADIAHRLILSQHTVKSHLYNIFRKIRVHNRHQAIQWAHDHLNLYIPKRTTEPES